ALAQAVQQAQLLQLQNQLRPHFIFNALNSIRALMFEDREAAAAMITGLSTLLRSSLQGEQGLTTLADDWALAQHYLHIEAVRLERRLRVQCDITPALAARPLPAFTLLTLCENAIKHGIAPLSEGGSLLIRAQESTDGWQLQVCNPCTSARPEGLSLGLANLRERLRLLQPDARIEAGRDGDQYRVCLSFTGAKHAHHAGG
ncbi:sensor histidine kinase, partial [Chitinimonas sp.]|uniref:sensor histidine kinase n=1 Tax=Chitinimonas sp. TaxID=1934313 RepID=UPI0035B41713